MRIQKWGFGGKNSLLFYWQYMVWFRGAVGVRSLRFLRKVLITTLKIRIIFL